ncbi:(deoxy)nucleoside triphosphate pyrophosphohydrolase [Spongiactinospora sp. TRM90649]|uniref:(deoxy)nucleoside triphosphate pyrophosphohydrolase n=1 Tax=Spongiactinospora sp. TRM90649 TaxID=3031114 RepID=UPI0023F928C4|nr:(deoxy)nucleoside triphosphate pyrophosphohydrolase [Spongiactinospora sp. TRM90649]MDF5754688.1 (deoxy)nucleoside triphosphate pyrophosphohydrolase [Spongiactinospora sp. TRM90649]
MGDQIVVGAAIVSGGKLLSAQRAEPPELYGGWEFPGGKVNPGESEIDALIRECDEELGVLIEAGRRVGGDWPLADGYVLRVWLARVVAGVPEPKEHLELRWLGKGELYDVPWLPADLPIVHAVEGLLGED